MVVTSPVHSPVHGPVQSPESRFCSVPHLCGCRCSIVWDTAKPGLWTGPWTGLWTGLVTTITGFLSIKQAALGYEQPTRTPEQVSCPDPPNALREKGSGQKGRTSVSPRSKSCGANQIAEA